MQQADIVAELKGMWKKLKGEIRDTTATINDIKHAHEALILLNKKEDIGCEKCGAKEYLTADHIVPFWFLQQIGLMPELNFDADNIQILCRPCNQYKGARIDMLDKRTMPLLIKYIKLADERVNKLESISS